ncbi:MAG: ribulose-phosphate 3-epimerase [Victivallaceae bacterium]|nr:ribulose-phosphate 3-epimerase [Victivallaceae bacterium]
MKDIFSISRDKISVAPSLLAADFRHLSEEVERVEKAGAEVLHLDIMDGHFVPNISFGALVVKALRPASRMFFDAHLMISEPLRYAPDFVAAGADGVTFHVETERDPANTARELRKLGCAVGVSLKPGTPVEAVMPLLPLVDLVLVMSVEPGFGGQKFMPEVLPKATAIRREADRLGLKLHLEIDGGIDGGTVAAAAAAGVNMMVAGTAVFRHPDGAAAAIAALREAEVIK